MLQAVSTDKIRIDGGTQPRVEIDEKLVSEYADELDNKAKLPPIIVFFDGVDYWLADGFHRWHACKRLGRRSVSADVRKGTQRDAILFSVGANASHGKRRTNADKRKAVSTMLEDPEWVAWSDSEIARRCSVSSHFVGDLRKVDTLNIQSINDHQEQQERTFVHAKTGAPAKMNVAKIGLKATDESAPPEAMPEINQETGEGDVPSVNPLAPIGEITADGALVKYSDDPDLEQADAFEDEETEPVDENDMTDSEWLSELPLNSALAAFPGLRTFRADALAYRTLKQSGIIGSLKNRVDAAVRTAEKQAETRGLYLDTIRTASRLSHPRDWKLCPCCNGIGSYWMSKKDSKHLEPGTVPSTASNELEHRATLMNCPDCTGGYQLR